MKVTILSDDLDLDNKIESGQQEDGKGRRYYIEIESDNLEVIIEESKKEDKQ